MGVLQHVINVLATGSQHWPDQKKRLDAIRDRANREEIAAAFAEQASRDDCQPYDLAHETAVFGVGHPNMPLETGTQLGARIIRNWWRDR